MRKFEADGRTVQCHVYGQEENSPEKPVIVLFHGYGGNPVDWKEITEKLTDRFVVVIPNMATLSLKDKSFCFSKQVSYLQKFLHQLSEDHGPLYIAGASFGGALAWALRFKCREIVKKVIMINPMPPNPIRRLRSRNLRLFLRLSRFPWVLALLLKSRFGRRHLGAIAANVRPDWAMRKESFRGVLKRKETLIFHVICRFANIMQDENWKVWEANLAHEGPESLLIFGEQDQLFCADQAQWFAQQLHNCKVHFLARGAHMAIRTNPEEVFQLMSDFLKEDKTPLEIVAS